jgi:hypothetical protein
LVGFVARATSGASQNDVRALINSRSIWIEAYNINVDEEKIRVRWTRYFGNEEMKGGRKKEN